MTTDDEAWQWKRVIWYMKWYSDVKKDLNDHERRNFQ